MVRLFAILSLVLLSFGIIGPRPAQTAPASSQADMCKNLAGNAFAGVVDAPTMIVSANYVEATAERPAYCDVEGYVTPNNGFALWLPTKWNGKFLARGCGGFCGIVAGEFACKDPIRVGYACLQTDMGHKSTLTDATWAYHNLEAKVDFGYRSTHVTTLAGKAIVAKYYGQDAAKNYFIGCSTGGRQALVEAQRFPADFDGIVAIAPAMNETGGTVQITWSVLANRRNGHNILPISKLPMLHKAVVDACDLNDGLRDGLIGDPRRCNFRPASLLCKAGDRPDCLTAAQVAVVQKIYDGPRDSHGVALFPGGAPIGSEVNWGTSYLGAGDQLGHYAPMMTEFWRYLGFTEDPGPSWNLEQFDFDHDPERTGGMESIYTGANPDLRRFKQAGGKLLLVQGLTDDSVAYGQTIDYYEQTTRYMGGPDATKDFFRFFIIPGMNHCTGGEGAYAIDYLTSLQDWRETNDAPDRLVGEHPKDGMPIPYLGIAMTLTPDQATMRRPFYAWPAETIYKGTGDPNDPDSWMPHL